MVVFRADANAEIGEGHVMRCVAIAKELLRQGKEAVIVTADEYPSELLRGEGLDHIVLNTDWTRMDEEPEILLPLLKEIGADCMLVDSYNASPKYFECFKGKVKTAYMDDFGLLAYPVDIIINYHAYCNTIPYHRIYAYSGALCLLGPAYVPLRREFRSRPKVISEQVHDIMITTGSTDPYNISGRLLNRISDDHAFSDIKVHMVAGRYYTNIDELESISHSNPQMIIHKNITNMSELMALCDIAVSASGTTVYELCACGIPSIIFSFVDNQTQIREYFGSRRAMIDCGDIRHLKEICLDKIISGLKRLSSREERTALYMNAANITDGCGAERLAECLAAQT